MDLLDLAIIVAYALGLLALGYFFKQQKDEEDYYLGGRSFGWFELGLSTMATQLSAVSFLSASAFVGIRAGGGLKWLSYDLAVPLAMVFLITLHLPRLYRSGVVTIYEYLERRFDQRTRILISGVFQLSRSAATGIMLYTMAFVLANVLGIPLWQTIIGSGIVTIVYAYQGGMKAVVWGDAVQMILLLSGIVVCIFFGLHQLGGWEAFASQLDPDRLQAIDFSVWGLGEDDGFGFWPMLLGGFFLYASYYGCDQSEVQRALSARDYGTVRKALLFNGVARFPITLAYCLMGLIVGTFALSEPAFGQQIPADHPDYMMPIFIANYLPSGIRGLLLVAILAAAMSSLSSAVNSLSATTVRDFIVRLRPQTPAEAQLRYAKWASLGWGIACIGIAFLAGGIAKTVVEAINKIGSVFYGPVLATFLLALLSRRTHPLAANVGLVAGVGLNLLLWLVVGEERLFWIWWNLTGTAATFLVGMAASYLLPGLSRPVEDGSQPFFSREALILLLWFFVITTVAINLPGWLG
ncbi:MAG: sodium transporter [Bacteroidetes bacterium]|nr:MAG: sodium transporter [Bacteroidota bacterium]